MQNANTLGSLDNICSSSSSGFPVVQIAKSCSKSDPMSMPARKIQKTPSEIAHCAPCFIVSLNTFKINSRYAVGGRPYTNSFFRQKECVYTVSFQVVKECL